MKRKFLMLLLILALSLGMIACKDNSKESDANGGEKNLLFLWGQTILMVF